MDCRRATMCTSAMSPCGVARGDQTSPPAGTRRRPGFNIGTGQGTSVWEIAKLLEKAAGRSVAVELAPARPGEQQESFVNADKARELLGWIPEVTLANGLKKSFEWFANQRNGVTV